MMRNVRLGALLDVILPPSCLFCGDDLHRGDLCGRCDALLARSWPPLATPCRLCGLPRPSEPLQAPEQPCGSCPKKRFPFDGVIPLAVYQGAVREAVVASKRPEHAVLAHSLGLRLGAKIKDSGFENAFDRVTFVPSHAIRRIFRGGPSGVQHIAAAVGESLTTPMTDLLQATRWTGKQSLLPDELRPLNVRGAFRLKRCYVWKSLPDLRDQHILLVDDVLTTGSTATEATLMLKDAGAATVRLAVVARAVRR
jgi:predicted amidophosphoribosyltransferase